MTESTTPDRRFQVALERSCARWNAADPARAAALAGCTLTSAGIEVPFFGAVHVASHPSGEVVFKPTGRPAHPSVAVAVLHYLLTADGTPPADRWLAFRELPDGLFYAQAFAGHAELLLAQTFGSDLARFHSAAVSLGGDPLGLGDASYRFAAFPRLAIAAVLWEGDDEFPAQARILFDASAGHYLPTEDLSGIGDWLAHRLAR